MGDDKVIDLEKIQEELKECEARLARFGGEGAEKPEDLEGAEEELNYCKIQLQEAKDKSEDEWLSAKHSIVTRLERLKKRLDSRARRERGGIT